MRHLASLLVLFVSLGWMAAAFADPPAHAPAHGWRKKHDPYYVGYSGHHWENDYDISDGHCNREAIGAVIGGVAGGVLGSRVGDRNGDRTVATIIGAAIGALIGAKVGRDLDEGDRRCIGHALEIARPGQPVRWDNGPLRYELVAGEGRRSSAGLCRDFTLRVTGEDGRSRRKSRACENEPGVWKIDPPSGGSRERR